MLKEFLVMRNKLSFLFSSVVLHHHELTIGFYLPLTACARRLNTHILLPFFVFYTTYFHPSEQTRLKKAAETELSY